MFLVHVYVWLLKILGLSPRILDYKNYWNIYENISQNLLSIYFVLGTVLSLTDV